MWSPSSSSVGVLDNPGINQRALRLLFSEVTDKLDWDYKISVSMVEIYNEMLRFTSRTHRVQRPEPEDINRVFELGHMNRATACTNLNEHSSPACERRSASTSPVALGDVINALRGKHSHVSPLPGNVSESVCSLKFAQRVRSVEFSASSSSSRKNENSSTSSSPTHDSVELDSPPVTPVPLPISRASSAGSSLSFSSSSRTPSSRRRTTEDDGVRNPAACFFDARFSVISPFSHGRKEQRLLGTLRINLHMADSLRVFLPC
ncbi:hypothetical protein F7725_025747 [Dissostichus mawsoni]|uniref:Kinesin motor domain-containing protein n=1 Tax=Dissostichus mawsoni TaxID=36200 RepID=A0A7J5X546_DISMA|nr:hypothetical protein F7725_025747 [Dissostichus mawsoni]